MKRMTALAMTMMSTVNANNTLTGDAPVRKGDKQVPARLRWPF
ncbi:hypothetical protein SODG_005274 [Sodalis praecaptivus]|nr:hypothetical protein NVIRENTERO_00090 [Sodalis praecaptivus]